MDDDEPGRHLGGGPQRQRLCCDRIARRFERRAVSVAGRAVFRWRFFGEGLPSVRVAIVTVEWPGGYDSQLIGTLRASASFAIVSGVPARRPLSRSDR